MMTDRFHTTLLPGDKIKTTRDGVLTVKRQLAPDNGQGALVLCANIKGSRIEIRLVLSGAELVRVQGGHLAQR